MSECSSNCDSCGRDCKISSNERSIKKEKLHMASKVKKVIAIVSGKGGVGKSIVTSMLAVLMSRRQFRTAILDADITGPSIPKAFGLSGGVYGSGEGLHPVVSKFGTQIMSLNLLTQNETDPVIWRGPVIGNSVRQFWTDVVWENVDFMFIDMPPGTGDVPLTVYQSLPVDGIIIVTTPQDLVSMIVRKAANMAQMMKIPILGLVENMSYVICPCCNEKINLYGDGSVDEIAKEYNIDAIAKMPTNPEFSKICDRGLIELFEGTWLDNIADMLEKMIDEGRQNG